MYWFSPYFYLHNEFYHGEELETITFEQNVLSGD